MGADKEKGYPTLPVFFKQLLGVYVGKFKNRLTHRYTGYNIV